MLFAGGENSTALKTGIKPIVITEVRKCEHDFLEAVQNTESL